MSTAITPLAVATRTTQTITPVATRLPYDDAQTVYGTPIDLVDARTVSLTLSWSPITPSTHASTMGLAEVFVETSADQVAWRSCLAFSSRPSGLTAGSETISGVADRYLRAGARIASRVGQAAGAVSFGVAGQAA